jgi:Ras-related protein Rab-35
MNIKLFETSAKENINVEEMFRAVTELVLKSKLEQQSRLNNQVTANNKHTLTTKFQET